MNRMRLYGYFHYIFQYAVVFGHLSHFALTSIVADCYRLLVDTVLCLWIKLMSSYFVTNETFASSFEIYLYCDTHQDLK